MRGDVSDYRVMILYEKGPETPGSWHPKGHTRTQLKDSFIEIWLAVGEFRVGYVMRLPALRSAWSLTFFLGGSYEQTLERRGAW